MSAHIYEIPAVVSWITCNVQLSQIKLSGSKMVALSLLPVWRPQGNLPMVFAEPS